MILKVLNNKKAVNFIFILLLAGLFSPMMMWAESPVGFNLYSKDEPGILFTVDAPQWDNQIFLELINNSGGDIFLNDFGDFEPGKKAFHFILQFDPGIFDEESISGTHQIKLSEESAEEWKMDLTKEGAAEFVRLYLLAGAPGKWAAHEKRYITLINAGAKRGSRGQTKVTLKSSNITGEKGGSLPEGEEDIPIRIINFFVKKEVPLYAGFSDSHTVLNDGVSKNDLELRITNVLTHDPEVLLFKYSSNSTERSRLIVFFDLPGSPGKWFSQNKGGQSSIDVEDWHLASGDDIKEIAVTAEQTGWKIEKDLLGAFPKWVIEPSKAHQYLKPHDTLDFKIEGIITPFRSGGCNLYVLYENIPGYRDGQLVCPIVKQPLFVKDKKVGIGTSEPESDLHVKGELGVDGAVGVKGELDVDGPVGVKGALDVDGAVGVKGALDVDGTFGVKGPLGVEGPLEVKGSIKLNGSEILPFPVGAIMMWAGAKYAIPIGWVICDGQNSTPKLPAFFQAGSPNPVYYIMKVPG